MSDDTAEGADLFLAQFAGHRPPYDSLQDLARWAARHGFVGVQVPPWMPALFRPPQAAATEHYHQTGTPTEC